MRECFNAVDIGDAELFYPKGLAEMWKERYEKHFALSFGLVVICCPEGASSVLGSANGDVFIP
jgi:hypothetical protein